MKFYLFLVGVSAAGLVESSVFGISCLVRLASSVATSFWISSWSSFSRTTRFFKMSFFNCSFWRYNFLYCINHNHHTISIIKQQTQTKWKEKENPINKIPNSFSFSHSPFSYLLENEKKRKPKVTLSPTCRFCSAFFLLSRFIAANCRLLIALSGVFDGNGFTDFAGVVETVVTEVTVVTGSAPPSITAVSSSTDWMMRLTSMEASMVAWLFFFSDELWARGGRRLGVSTIQSLSCVRLDGRFRALVDFIGDVYSWWLCAKEVDVGGCSVFIFFSWNRCKFSSFSSISGFKFCCFSAFLIAILEVQHVLGANQVVNQVVN